MKIRKHTGAQMTPNAMQATISRIDTDDEFQLLRDKWNGLLAESPANNFFLRWEWLWCWWKAYRSENHELSILLIRDGDELLCIAPFYLVNTNWKGIYSKRALYWLGTRQGAVISEYMDFICKKGFEDITVRSVLEYIEKTDLADELVLQQMESSSKTIEALKKMSSILDLLYIETERREGAYITLPRQFEVFLESLGSTMRQKIRRNQSRVDGVGKAVIRRTTSLSELDDDFNEFVRLHQCRWESRGKQGSFSKRRFTDFLRMVTAEALKNGHLELSFLSIAGRNIAALYNLNYNNKIFFLQSGLDHAFNPRLSPGMLLHVNSIQSAIESGLSEYDFLLMGSHDDYKKKFTVERRHLFSIRLVRPVSLRFFTLLRSKIATTYNYCKRH